MTTLSAKMSVPMLLHSQRSRKKATCVWCPNRFPKAQSRVPMKKIVSGMTKPEEEAIKP